MDVCFQAPDRRWLYFEIQDNSVNKFQVYRNRKHITVVSLNFAGTNFRAKATNGIFEREKIRAFVLF
jgi:hypothetical protein